MNIFDRLRKKLRRDAEHTFEIDEGSDLPIHEHYTKEEDILTMKEKQKQEKQKRTKR